MIRRRGAPPMMPMSARRQRGNPIPERPLQGRGTAHAERAPLAMSELSFWSFFVVGALATWRAAHLIAREDGPADMVFRLRLAAGQGVLGRAMDCFHCAVIWVAAPLALVFADSL